MLGEVKIRDSKGKYFTQVFLSVPLNCKDSCRGMYYFLGYYVGTSFRLIRRYEDVCEALDDLEVYKTQYPSRKIALYRFTANLTKYDE